MGIGRQSPTANRQWLNSHFGDLITKSKNESREIFIHIPTEQEIMHWLEKSGFKVKETFYRSDKFEESEKVKAKSGECRFWIVAKSL